MIWKFLEKEMYVEHLFMALHEGHRHRKYPSCCRNCVESDRKSRRERSTLELASLVNSRFQKRTESPEADEKVKWNGNIGLAEDLVEWNLQNINVWKLRPETKDHFIFFSEKAEKLNSLGVEHSIFEIPVKAASFLRSKREGEGLVHKVRKHYIPWIITFILLWYYIV